MNLLTGIIGGSIFVALFSFVMLVFVLLFMKKEGRYHLSRSIFKSGIDLISIEPKSRGLECSVIKWTGDYFEQGDEAILFNFDPLLNPNNPLEKMYNQVISETCYWKGSKRPVLFASEAAGFVFNPHISSAIEQAKNHEDYTKVKPILENLQSMFSDKIVKIRFMQTFKPDNIRDFLNSGSTGTKNMMLAEKMKLSGILQMTKKRDLSAVKKIAIPLGVLLLILLLWSQGVFDTLFTSFRP